MFKYNLEAGQHWMNPPQPTWVSEQASDTVAGNPGPHSQILMKGVGGGGGGGPTEVHIL